ISTYSKHPEEAYEAAMCLRNEKHQLDMAIKSGNAPVLEKLYQEPELRKVYPMGDVMLAELKNAVPRPVTPIYQNISTITSTNLSPPQSMNPQRDERELRRLIQQAIDGKGILP
ncbi:MAG TPA: ABC transporter substrate-binding protein, partial [Gemmatimonadota bacterium]|nr:ABC transporter substrate-binding protein [Gemmatimonadota bacterium]